jgi:hypothetical protein
LDFGFAPQINLLALYHQGIIGQKSEVRIYKDLGESIFVNVKLSIDSLTILAPVF